MNISSFSPMSQLWQTLQAANVTQTGSTSTASSAACSSSSASSSDSTTISTPGQLFKELQSLSQSNPTEFKKITSEIAQQLQTAAQSSSDPGQADFLNSMASNFSKASQSGNFSDLFPSQSQQSSTSDSSSTSGTSQAPSMPPPPPPYGGHSSSTSSDSSSGSDPLSTIFAQALSQIQSDLSSTSTASSS